MARKLLGAACFLTTLISLPTIAAVETAKTDATINSNSTPSENRRTRSRLIEEVVVTAQKREEDLQDVPISIAAFSGDALDARGAYNTKDLALITPAVSITEFGGFTFIYIRGIGSDSFIPSADPSVTTYVDGIYVPTSQGLVTSFGGVERVEVLKGPQGTLFGRNSTGGAISVVTKKPSEEYDASLQLVKGNFNEERAKGFISGPITDWLAGSLDLLKDSIDHQYTHAARELDPERQKSVRARLVWYPTDNIDFDITYFKAEQDGQGSLLTKNINPSAVAGAALREAEDDYVADSDFPAALIGSHEVLSAVLDWRLPWFDIKIIGSDQLIDTEYTAFDFDATPTPVVAFEVKPSEYTDAKSFELQFLSNSEGWGGDKLEWVIGAYYLESEGGFADIDIPLGETQLEAILPAIPGIDDILEPLTSSTSLKATGLLGTESLSIFAQGTWFIRDWVSITLGARYGEEDRFLTASDVFLSPGNGAPDQIVTSYPLEEDSRSNTTTRAVASFFPSENSMIYLSRSEGYKSSTYNIVNLTDSPELVLPEEVTSYEIGLKSDFFDGLLRLNAAVFYNEIVNKQSSIVAVLGGGVIQFTNAEDTEIKGVEFDLVTSPLPNWNPGFTITANAAYLEGEYKKFTNGDGFDEETGVFVDGIDHSGNEIERTPKLSGGLALIQLFNLPWGDEFEVAVDAYYNSGFFYSAQNSDIYTEDKYTITNARISYLYVPWNLRLTAFGQNVLGEKYHLGLFQTDFGINSSLAYPERYGLRLNWSLE